MGALQDRRPDVSPVARLNDQPHGAEISARVQVTNG
jgi:hypothetical protein